MALRIIGGWGNRPDSAQSCATRLLSSLQLMPQREHGPWGVWRPHPGSEHDDLSPIRVETIDDALAALSACAHPGPSTSGHHVRLGRRAAAHTPDAEPRYLEYAARVGFTDAPTPFNHLLLRTDEGGDPSILFDYMNALVMAWHPDHLGLTTRAVQRAQGHRPSQAVIGFLTYLRAGTPLDRAALGRDIDVVEAGRGCYVRVPGTPMDPSLDHIDRVRDALGYPLG